jgi:hypothetical protein
LAGKCNTYRGIIRIYPKTSAFCRTFGKKFGKSILISYVSNRARAALIHELLHLKYISDEQKVRALTETYFTVYMKMQLNKNSAVLQGLIFSHKIAALLIPAGCI